MQSSCTFQPGDLKTGAAHTEFPSAGADEEVRWSGYRSKCLSPCKTPFCIHPVRAFTDTNKSVGGWQKHKEKQENSEAGHWTQQQEIHSDKGVEDGRFVCSHINILSSENQALYPMDFLQGFASPSLRDAKYVNKRLLSVSLGHSPLSVGGWWGYKYCTVVQQLTGSPSSVQHSFICYNIMRYHERGGNKDVNKLELGKGETKNKEKMFSALCSW